MNRLKHWIVALVFVAGIGGSATAVMMPQVAVAGCNANTRFLTMPTWYRGVVDSNCNIVINGHTVNSDGTGQASRQTLATFIWRIALNIVEIMMHIVGYAAVMFIIYGGFLYLTSTGQPDKVTSAKKTIMNAAIGLVISVFAIAIVNVVVGAF